MANQSDELTFLCSEPVTVMYEDESWNTCAMSANLEEISPTSATVLSEECPQPWRPIALSIKGQDLYGVVESIEVDGVLGYFVKIKLDAQSQWQKQLGMPAHFLAVRRSTKRASVDSRATLNKYITLGRR